MQDHTQLNDLDTPIWGAEAIGRAAGVLIRKGKNKGKVDLRKTYYYLQRGYIGAEKRGAQYVTTTRRARAVAQSSERAT